MYLLIEKDLSSHVQTLLYVALLSIMWSRFFYLSLCVCWAGWKQIGLVRSLFTVLKDRGPVALHMSHQSVLIQWRLQGISLNICVCLCLSCINVWQEDQKEEFLSLWEICVLKGNYSHTAAVSECFSKCSIYIWEWSVL